MSSNKPYTKTVRLSDNQRQQILDEMDQSQEIASDKVQPESNRRADTRYPYRKSDIPIVVEQPGGVITRLSVSPRNLSSGGIAFLHGGFLYVGSKCSLQLSAPATDPIVVSGEIVNCRHVDGILHEVSVKFVKPIEPGLFTSLDTVKTDSKSCQEPPKKETG